MRLKTSDDIARLLERSLEGARVAELCREFGISRATLFRTRARYGIGPAQLARVLELERAHRQSVRRRSRLAGDVSALQDLLCVCLRSTDARRAGVAHLVANGISERRASQLLRVHRGSPTRRVDPATKRPDLPQSRRAR